MSDLKAYIKRYSCSRPMHTIVVHCSATKENVDYNKDDIKRLISIEKHSEGYQYRYYDIDNNVDYSLIIKNNYKEEVKYFAPGSVLVFNGRKEVEQEIETYTFNKPGIYLIRK